MKQAEVGKNIPLLFQPARLAKTVSYTARIATNPNDTSTLRELMAPPLTKKLNSINASVQRDAMV